MEKTQIIKFIIGYSILFNITPLAFAHGENKPGPHGGIVRMPSSFHSEVVPITDLNFKVYLLDFYFKNPITLKSKVEGIVESGKSMIPVTCKSNIDFFECEILKNYQIKNSKLRLSTIREEIKGIEMVYELPLVVK